jgi:membrane-bound ClpP family serine protease
VLGIAVSLVLRSATHGKLSKSAFVLHASEDGEAGYDAVADMQAYLGRTGETRTVLRPVGVAEFGDKRIDVVTEGEYIEKNQVVTVSRVEGSRIVVRKLEPGEQPQG